jgi:very-short-patch-repair endonuclease
VSPFWPDKLKIVARENARAMRKAPTKAESLLWEALRARRFLNKKFLRQYPIPVQFEDRETFFIADFYCASAHLIVEVDGEVHETTQKRDMERDLLLTTMGFRVVRLANELVVHEMDAALRVVERAIHT